MNLVKMIHLGVWGILMWSIVTMSPMVYAASGEVPKIYNILPKDAIRAVLEPEFVSVDDAKVADEAEMIGVVLNAEAHVYSAVLLNSHEVVNDTVGGAKIATTW